MTLVLLIVETLFIYVALPETRGKGIKADPSEKANGTSALKEISPRRAATVEGRVNLLQKLRKAHFLFLATFSGASARGLLSTSVILTMTPTGVEFTLTFLCFDRKLDIGAKPEAHANTMISVRLEQHAKRQTTRPNRCPQHTPPRRLRPSQNVLRRRRRNGPPRHLNLRPRPRLPRHPPQICPKPSRTGNNVDLRRCRMSGVHICDGR